MAIEALCRRYPAYTPETAAEAPAWLLRHMELLTLAGVDQPAQGDSKRPEPSVPGRRDRTQAETERMLFG